MSALAQVAAVLAVLGSALIGGVFFAFSGFIMRALGRLPDSEGIVAMQSINVDVLNRAFLGSFVGTAAIALLLAGIAVATWGTPPAPWFLAGALAYLFGTFLVTGLGNVPLNQQLAEVDATDPQAAVMWRHYLEAWTRLNTIRTAAALVAALSFMLGLLSGANG